MKARNKVSWMAATAVMAAVLVGGCSGIVDQQAKEALMQSLGDTSVTVFPTFVRSTGGAYDADSVRQIGEYLTSAKLAEVTLSDQEVPITGSWGMNQAKMLRESAEAFAAHIKTHPIETDYAMLAEFLIGGAGNAVGIHGYVLDADGTVAFALLLNSHHKAFAAANPQTVEECTALFIQVLNAHLEKRDKSNYHEKKGG